MEGTRGGEREREGGAGKGDRVQAEPEEGGGRELLQGRGEFGFFFFLLAEKKKEKEEKHEAGRAAFSFFFFSFFFLPGGGEKKKTVNEKNDSDEGENKTRHKNQSHLERERVSC